MSISNGQNTQAGTPILSVQFWMSEFQNPKNLSRHSRYFFYDKEMKINVPG
jgi:hypothetical protein